MSIYHTAPSRCTKNSERISQKIEEFLSAGGEIQQIPTGQGAYNLQIREVKNRSDGSRRAWVDERMHMSSEAGKGASVRRRIAKEAERAAAKRRSDQARARRDSLMPRVRQLRAQGKSRREIAAIVDVAHGTIGNWLKLEGDDDG